MSGRLARTLRLLAIQRQRDQLSEWQLRELSSQSAVLDERYHSLTRFLEEESAFSGMFSVFIMRRLQRLAELRAKAARDHEAQRELHLHDRGCLRRLERTIRTLESAENRNETARELGEMVDAAAHRLSQGSRKLAKPLFETADLSADVHGVD
jgi:chromosome segregation ATPase